MYGLDKQSLTTNIKDKIQTHWLLLLEIKPLQNITPIIFESNPTSPTIVVSNKLIDKRSVFEDNQELTNKMNKF